MARPKKKESNRKTKIIRFLVTEEEFEKYNSHKSGLLKHSPALTPSEILRSCSKKIDSKALVMFLMMDSSSLLYVQLTQEFDFMFMDNKDITDG